MDEQSDNVKSYVSKTFIATSKEKKSIEEVMNSYVKARNVVSKTYNYFNGRNLYELLDDSLKRWNGYIPATSPLIDQDQSRIFLNFTRNLFISYLSKVALQKPKIKIKAVNKKTNIKNQRISELYKDLVDSADNQENADAKFLQTAMETGLKGTAFVYEGYRRDQELIKIPVKYDAVTGQGTFKKEMVTTYDNVFQKVWPLEDVMITNAWQPDIQKQVINLRQITTHGEAKQWLGHHKLFKFVKAGSYTIIPDQTTFFRQRLMTELADDQDEILLHYNPFKKKHVLMCNGVPLYTGPYPWKNGKTPLSRYIYEPYGQDFMYGMPFPIKFMGEQDLANTFINMGADKTLGSLLPYGLSSDLDDLIEDDQLQLNKIRKVSDINNWKFDTLPGISSGEMGYMQMIFGLLKENAGDISGGAGAQTARGGKVNVRQVLLKQQESMQKMGFSMSFMEDGERDRTDLRLAHILQFYSIPKIEKITGKNGKEVEQLLYREVKAHDVTMQDGQKGNRLIHLVDGESMKTEDDRTMLADELSVKEEEALMQGETVEAVALSVDTFYDYNTEVEIVKDSSYSKNQILDQAARQEYADWRLKLLPLGVQTDLKELVKWVDESYDIDTERFEPKQQPGQPGMPPGAPGMPPGMPQGGGMPGMPQQPQAQPAGLPTPQEIMTQ